MMTPGSHRTLRSLAQKLLLRRESVSLSGQGIVIVDVEAVEVLMNGMTGVSRRGRIWMRRCSKSLRGRNWGRRRRGNRRQCQLLLIHINGS